jgi:hypothetical protein
VIGMMLSRRSLLGGALSLVALPALPCRAGAARPTITVYKDPT